LEDQLDNFHSHSDHKDTNLPELPAIVRSPAVAVVSYKDGVGTIWTGFVLALSGLYPLVTLLTTLGNPRHMNTMGSWLLVSLVMFAGIIVLGFGVKEKGYQKDSIRVFGISAFSAAVLLFLITPVTASLMYAFGIGN
jgi:hypothetical protein